MFFGCERTFSEITSLYSIEDLSTFFAPRKVSRWAFSVKEYAVGKTDWRGFDIILGYAGSIDSFCVHRRETAAGVYQGFGAG